MKEAPITARRIGWVKGQPIRFVHGHNRRQPLHTRFWKMVNVRGPVVRRELGRCYLWRGALLQGTGYGAFTYSTGPGVPARTTSAHRFAWQQAHGPIPPGISILHRCDTRACVRESHLFRGTQRDNAADMVQKGRQTLGVMNPNARLNDRAVLAIRRGYARGLTQDALARRYRVHSMTVHAIVHGRLWRHVGGPTVHRSMRERLTDEEVAAIRTRYRLGKAGLTRLARLYSTSRQTIWRIVHGKQRRGVR